jgi:hypothetical protein
MTFLLFFFCLFLALPARADNYVDPTFADIVRTLVRFNAIDLQDDDLIDEYAMVTDCNLFTHFYPNDFKWNEVRAAIRKSVSLNIATFPTRYHFDIKIQLDRYDFKQKNFRFTDSSAIHNVNPFLFVSKPDYKCGKNLLKYLPTDYHAVLDAPVSITGLPFAESDADPLLHRMDASGNTNHAIYARFRLRVTDAEFLHRVNPPDGKPYYAQNNQKSGHNMLLGVHLDVVDFYEDENMTKLIYSYKP